MCLLLGWRPWFVTIIVASSHNRQHLLFALICLAASKTCQLRIQVRDKFQTELPLLKLPYIRPPEWNLASAPVKVYFYFCFEVVGKWIKFRKYFFLAQQKYSCRIHIGDWNHTLKPTLQNQRYKDYSWTDKREILFNNCHFQFSDLRLKGDKIAYRYFFGTFLFLLDLGVPPLIWSRVR